MIGRGSESESSFRSLLWMAGDGVAVHLEARVCSESRGTWAEQNGVAHCRQLFIALAAGQRRPLRRSMRRSNHRAAANYAVPHARGEEHPGRTLTEREVRQMRKDRLAKRSFNKIASSYAIALSTAFDAITGNVEACANRRSRPRQVRTEVPRPR